LDWEVRAILRLVDLHGLAETGVVIPPVLDLPGQRFNATGVQIDKLQRPANEREIGLGNDLGTLDVRHHRARTGEKVFQAKWIFLCVKYLFVPIANVKHFPAALVPNLMHAILACVLVGLQARLVRAVTRRLVRQRYVKPLL